MKTVRAFITAAIVATLGGVIATPLDARQSQHPAYEADHVIKNANIYTLDSKSTEHHNSSIAYKDGIITWIGADTDLPSDLSKPIVDANGYTILPGLIDSHVHMLSAGRAILRCNLNYEALTAEALRAALQICLNNDDFRHKDKPENEDFLVAVAWDRKQIPHLTFQSPKSSGFLDKNGRDAYASDLAALYTTRPIMVITSDVHTTFTNDRGLELSGITEDTPNPDSGKYVHFPNGNLTGVFEDSAALKFFNEFAYFTDEEYAEFALAAMKVMSENGITTIMDAGSTIHEPAAFKANLDEGKILTRSHFCQAIAPEYMKNSTEDTFAFIDALSQMMANATHDFESATKPSIIWRHFKALMDGIAAAPAVTAAMTWPYNVEGENGPVPGNISNTPNYNASFMSTVMQAIHDKGLGLHIHSIGDNSTLQVLEALESLSGKIDSSKVAIAHLEFLAPEHWPRVIATGSPQIMTFQWAQNSGAWYSQTGDFDTAQALGEERMSWAEPWGNLTALGSKIVYGSDYPVDPFDPWLALKVGVTRTGDPLNPISAANMSSFWTGPINNLSVITREQALRGMTTYGAEWLKLDSHTGSLEIGKWADMIIVRDDYFKVPETLIGQNKVLATLLGGRATYLTPDIEDYGITMTGGNLSSINKRSVLSVQDHLWLPEARDVHEQLDRRIVNKLAYLGRSLKARAAGDTSSLSCGCGH